MTTVAGTTVVGLSDLSDRIAVLQAMAEYDELGREAFLSRYEYGPARSYFLVHDGKRHDSTAIAGVAVGKQFPGSGPLASSDLSGGEATEQAKLEPLGFQFVHLDDESEGVGRNYFTRTWTRRPWMGLGQYARCPRRQSRRASKMSAGPGSWGIVLRGLPLSPRTTAIGRGVAIGRALRDRERQAVGPGSRLRVGIVTRVTAIDVPSCLTLLNSAMGSGEKG